MNPKAIPAPEDIRAVFFDIDGTLVSHETGKIPDSAFDALRGLKARGIKVCLASGRYPEGVGWIEKLFPFDACVSTNGQYCYVPGGERIHQLAFTPEQVRTVKDYVEAHRLASIFVAAHDYRINFPNGAMEENYALFRKPMPPVLTEGWLESQEIIQFIVYSDPRQDHAMEEAMSFLHCARAVPTCADVMPRQGGKHMGIRAVCRHFGFGIDQAAAFGDSYNDLEMLQHCALGVAMAGAPQPIRDCARFVTNAPDDHGIYNALQSYGLIG